VFEACFLCRLIVGVFQRENIGAIEKWPATPPRQSLPAIGGE
jgi:hypothetical protein